MERGTDEGQGELRRDPEQSVGPAGPAPGDGQSGHARGHGKRAANARGHSFLGPATAGIAADMLCPPKVPACLSDIT